LRIVADPGFGLLEPGFELMASPLQTGWRGGPWSCDKPRVPLKMRRTHTALPGIVLLKRTHSDGELVTMLVTFWLDRMMK
jgi:hypothetical protein